MVGQAAGSYLWTNPPPNGWPKQNESWSLYRSANAGMKMMMQEWAPFLTEDGVKVWVVSPGLLATGLGGDRETLKKMGARESSVGS